MSNEIDIIRQIEKKLGIEFEKVPLDAINEKTYEQKR